MTVKYTNNAVSTLAAGISSGATSLTVASGQGVLFPTLTGADVFYVTLQNLAGVVEIVKVTARATDTFTIVRAQDGTTAHAWDAGDSVELRVIAQELNNTLHSADIGVTVQGYSAALTSYAQYGAGFRNRIINGAMMIDQRNAGASVTPTDAQYVVDRFMGRLTQASKFSLQQVSTAPAGFVKSLQATSLSAFTVGASDRFSIEQNIEGLNVADLGWGTAGAATVTLSFWVRSSLTGTFSVSLINSAANRSYPATYTISSANTWEQKSITIAGDTSGTWLTDNGIGIRCCFNLGGGSSVSGTAGAWAAGWYPAATGATSVVGTNSATFYITGVQLEKGSTATSFDYRPYGTELSLCQRYYWKGTINAGGVFGGSGGSVPIVAWGFPVTMRSSPTFAWVSGGSTSNGNSDYTITGVTGYSATTDSLRILWSQSGSTGANAQGAMTTGALCSNSSEL